MLFTFLRVREVSTLVSRHAAAGHRARRRRTPASRSRRPPSTLARAPGPPYPTDAHPRRSAAARAPPPPAQARRRFPCFAPPLGHRSRWPPRRSGSRTRAPRRCCSRAAARAAAGQPPPRAARPGACAPPHATARALPGGEETPPTDQWGPLVSGVRGGVLFILLIYFGCRL